MCILLLYILGSKWSPFQKILVILQKCLEEGQKFWKSQGKIREFHVGKNVRTLKHRSRRCVDLDCDYRIGQIRLN